MSFKKLTILILILALLNIIETNGIDTFRDKTMFKRDVKKMRLNYVNDAIKLYLNKDYLKVVKLANETIDSKTVVDRPTKKSLNETLVALKSVEDGNKQQAIQFVNEYLNEPGSEILKIDPIDWNSSPVIIESLQSNELKSFAKALNNIWLDLYRTVDESLYSKGFVTSHLPMPHPFVVPGGRFKEMYYWDTYWTMEGLLVCDMHKTVRMMLENFISFIEDYGFIPNGSRVYYLNRSQPPYFAQMVQAYYDYSFSSTTIDDAERSQIRSFVLDKALPAIEKEYEFWMNKKVVSVRVNNKDYELNVFKVDTNEPRPESYNEDVETASNAVNDEEKARIYADKASAAESGYDFSSRWFKEPTKLETIQTRSIIPVDLNAILYKTERILSNLLSVKGDSLNSMKYLIYAAKRRDAINSVLWSPQNSYWADYDISQNKLNDDAFYVFGLAPLWYGIDPPSKSAQKVINSNFANYAKYEGGIPVSFINSTEQWDFPNVWAPNQHSVIMMLNRYDKELALKIARNFFNSVYLGWKKHGVFYEKYNALEPGERGLGGEYEVQSGFGWTNGVMFKLMQIYKDDLIIPS